MRISHDSYCSYCHYWSLWPHLIATRMAAAEPTKALDGGICLVFLAVTCLSRYLSAVLWI